VVVTQLSIQLSKPISEVAKITSIENTISTIANMSSRATNSTRCNESGTMAGRFPSPTAPEVPVETSQPSNPNAESKDNSKGEAERTVESYRTDVSMKDTKQENGENNVMGAQLKQRTGDVKIDMEKTYQGSGSGNVTGLNQS